MQDFFFGNKNHGFELSKITKKSATTQTISRTWDRPIPTEFQSVSKGGPMVAAISHHIFQTWRVLPTVSNWLRWMRCWNQNRHHVSNSHSFVSSLLLLLKVLLSSSPSSSSYTINDARRFCATVVLEKCIPFLARFKDTFRSLQEPFLFPLFLHAMYYTVYSREICNVDNLKYVEFIFLLDWNIILT